MDVHLTLEIPHSLGFLPIFMKLSFSYSLWYWSALGLWPQTFSLPMKVKVKSISHVWVFVVQWTVAYQAPLSVGFSMQEYWSGFPFSSLGDLPDQGIEPGSSCIAGRCFTVWAIRKSLFSTYAAAAAKSLQSCPTQCDPIDGRPPGSPVPGILQARTLEWVAISFSNEWKRKVKVKLLSRVQLSATPWIVAYQAPLSMGFSRQEYWSGVSLPMKVKWSCSVVSDSVRPRGL